MLGIREMHGRGISPIPLIPISPSSNTGPDGDPGCAGPLPGILETGSHSALIRVLGAIRG